MPLAGQRWRGQVTRLAESAVDHGPIFELLTRSHWSVLAKHRNVRLSVAVAVRRKWGMSLGIAKRKAA